MGEGLGGQRGESVMPRGPVCAAHTSRMSKRFRTLVFGVLVGAIAGAIVAVNVLVFSGAEDGYESSLPELYTTTCSSVCSSW